MRQTGERRCDELATDAVGAFEEGDSDVALASELFGGGEPGNAGTDDGNRPRAHMNSVLLKLSWSRCPNVRFPSGQKWAWASEALSDFHSVRKCHFVELVLDCPE